MDKPKTKAKARKAALDTAKQIEKLRDSLVAALDKMEPDGIHSIWISKVDCAWYDMQDLAKWLKD